MSFTPNDEKSVTLRVTTVSECTIAVVATIASSYRVSDLRCFKRTHTLNVGPSMGKTPYEEATMSAQASISAAFVASCSRVNSIPVSISPSVTADR